MKSQDIVLVGAGAMGREIASWLLDANKKTGDRQYLVKGFLDDNPGTSGAHPVIGGIQDYQPQPDELLLMTIADPSARQSVVEALRGKGGQFASFIHPSVIIGQQVETGEGCIICPNCVLGCDARIEAFTFINACSTIGHDCRIGAFTTINNDVNITGNNEVGERCFFGVGAKVIPGRKIGAGAVVGAGSVVVGEVKPGVTVFGNPAKDMGISRGG